MIWNRTLAVFFLIAFVGILTLIRQNSSNDLRSNTSTLYHEEEILTQRLGATISRGLFSSFPLRLFDDCDEEEDKYETEFSVKIYLDVGGNDILFDIPLMKWYFEYQFKRWMNRDYKEDGVHFHSVNIHTGEDRGLKRRATATGTCRLSDVCPPSPDFTYPTRIRGSSVTEFFTQLKESSFEAPLFKYSLEDSKDFFHEASFEQETAVGWSDLAYLSVYSNMDDAVVSKGKTCKTTPEECLGQRSAITSVFDKLEVDHDVDAHECSWQGVSCNTNNIITQLWVENHNTNKKLFPTEVTHLAHLTDLLLRNNALTGTLPATLSRLSNLKILSFELNHLTGNIPSQLGSLSKLTELNLNQNDFVDGIPSQIGNLKGLEVLDISRNQNLGGKIPEELGILTTLKTIILYDTNMNGQIPKSFSTLNHLQQLLLGNNLLTGNIDILSQLSTLKVLDMANNKLRGTIPEHFDHLQQLTSLNLYNNDFDGRIPTSVGSLSSLTQLIVGKNRLSRFIPVQIGSLEQLAVLDVSINRLTGEVPTELGNLRQLEVLNLSDNDLTGEASFLCGASFDFAVDEGEVTTCPDLP